MPQVKDTVFKGKPVSLLALRIWSITEEIVRLLELATPGKMLEALGELSFRHVGYGLQKDHAAPFCRALVAAVAESVESKGHPWKPEHGQAWAWACRYVADLLVDATQLARSKIHALER